jgi:uncharacterized protein DUF6959
MRVKPVEIYSDASNYAVMRHPGRRFPGSLIQGDSLHGLCSQADRVCATARERLDPDTYAELNDLRNELRVRLTHYKQILREHQIELPFNELS